VYHNILVALDGSAGSKAALRRAVQIARESGARLHALAVEDHLPRYAATVGEMEDARAEKDAFFKAVMDEARNYAAEHEVPLTTEVIVGHAAQQIVQRARQLGADLVAIGQSGHSSVWGNLLGTTAHKVSHHAPCDVLIVRLPDGRSA
jgi:nucleotide-binding universal stress UspA family protein